LLLQQFLVVQKDQADAIEAHTPLKKDKDQKAKALKELGEEIKKSKVQYVLFLLIKG